MTGIRCRAEGGVCVDPSTSNTKANTDKNPGFFDQIEIFLLLKECLNPEAAQAASLTAPPPASSASSFTLSTAPVAKDLWAELDPHESDDSKNKPLQRQIQMLE